MNQLFKSIQVNLKTNPTLSNPLVMYFLKALLSIIFGAIAYCIAIALGRFAWLVIDSELTFSAFLSKDMDIPTTLMIGFGVCTAVYGAHIFFSYVGEYCLRKLKLID